MNQFKFRQRASPGGGEDGGFNLNTGIFTGTRVLGDWLPEPALGIIPGNKVQPPELETEGIISGVASVSTISSVSRISSGTITSNHRTKYLPSSNSFLEMMRIQMVLDVQQRIFDKEDTKEKWTSEDRVRTERKVKENRDRTHFENTSLMVIGG